MTRHSVIGVNLNNNPQNKKLAQVLTYSKWLFSHWLPIGDGLFYTIHWLSQEESKTLPVL
jgi:hypothetical protein